MIESTNQFDVEAEARKQAENNLMTRVVVRFGPDFLLRAVQHGFRKQANQGPNGETLLNYQQKLEREKLPHDVNTVIALYSLVNEYTADKLNAELGRRAFIRAHRR